MQKPCLVCGTFSPDSRCPLHRLPSAKHTKPRPQYQGNWKRLAKRTVEAEPWCHNETGCPYPDAGSQENPLTADHVVPVVQGGGASTLTVLCRRCNSAKGGGRSR